MTPIQTNKHVFFDDEGNILEGGSIWIGQPNTDPRTNPKTVTFTDAGGSTFTAQQPLKTKAGRIVYNGKPIEATVDGEHSMLVFDSSGKQTDYYRSIGVDSGGTASDFSELTRVGLTLDDIKAFNVSVGNTVRNVGRTLVTDDLGADWLVVSATGNPADDVTLIDFDNGLQGQRIDSNLYSYVVADSIGDGSFDPEAATEVWTGSSTAVNMTALSESGPGYYVVIADSISFNIYVRALDEINAGSVYITNPSTNLLNWSNLRLTSLNDFKVQAYTYDAGTVTNSSVTITAIYKV